MLVDNLNYTYHRLREDPLCTKTYWTCSNRSCKVRVHTLYGKWEIIHALGAHNHDPPNKY